MFSNITNIKILPLYSRLVSVFRLHILTRCKLYRDIFYKREFTFLNWIFVKNFQILSVFQSSFTSNSFRIRRCPDQKLFFSACKIFRIRPDKDPQHCHGTNILAGQWCCFDFISLLKRTLQKRIYYFALNAEINILLGSLPGLLGGCPRPRPASALLKRWERWWTASPHASSSWPGCLPSGRICLCCRPSRAAMLRTGWRALFFGPAH